MNLPSLPSQAFEVLVNVPRSTLIGHYPVCHFRTDPNTLWVDGQQSLPQLIVLHTAGSGDYGPNNRSVLLTLAITPTNDYRLLHIHFHSE